MVWTSLWGEAHLVIIMGFKGDCKVLLDQVRQKSAHHIIRILFMTSKFHDFKDD